jgi:predicted glutamine amidotransferase
VEKVIDRYNYQRKRGTEGFGIYTPLSNTIRRATTEDFFLESLKSLQENERTEIFLHHRMPTSTDNTLTATHPFSTGNMFEHNYVLAHNGIIWNSKELHKIHEEQGITYQSVQEDGRFNDSESLLWEIALYLEGKADFPATQGGAAFIVIEQTHSGDGWKPIKLHFGRNDSNPLYLSMSDDDIILASERETWNDDAQSIMPGFLYTYNFRSKNMTLKPLQLESYRSYTPKAGKWDKDADGKYEWKPGSAGKHPSYLDPEDEYYARMADDYAKEASTSQMAPKQLTSGSDVNLITAEELNKAADDFLSKLMDECVDFDELEYRLSQDIKRSKQAVTQLGEQLEKGRLKPKSVKKYYKYRNYLQILLRAAAMFSFIVDPVEIVADET